MAWCPETRRSLEIVLNVIIDPPVEEFLNTSVCLDFPHCTVAAEHLQSVSQHCHPYSQATSMAKSTAMLNLLQRVLTFPAGWSSQQIYQRVCKEEFQEPLPDDCPEALRHLIHACRASSSFKRPSAGGKNHRCPLHLLFG